MLEFLAVRLLSTGLKYSFDEIILFESICNHEGDLKYLNLYITVGQTDFSRPSPVDDDLFLVNISTFCRYVESIY